MIQMAGMEQECRIESLSTMRYAQAHKLALAVYAHSYIRPTRMELLSSRDFSIVYNVDMLMPADLDLRSPDLSFCGRLTDFLLPPANSFLVRSLSWSWAR